MRIRVEVRDPLLRAAIADLAREAGHVVDTTGPAEGIGLTILEEPGTGAPAAPGSAVLCLRPGPGRRGAADPAAALRDAIARRGIALWEPPFDPDAFLDALSEAPRSPAPVDATPPADAPISRAPDPWLLLDVRRRDLVWATPAGREAFAVPGGTRLSAKGRHALPREVFEREAGAEIRPIEGRPRHVVWWTDSSGRRCVGVLPIPEEARVAEEHRGAVAALGRAAATLAHEIRNPLASFAGALDLLADETDAGERTAILALAHERLAQMRRMLDDALRFVHPFRGPPQPVSPLAVVREAIEAARTNPLFEHVDLRVECPGPVGEVLAHAEPLCQAVLDLLVNAAQAQGGEGRVTVRVDSAGVHGVIRVEDEGPGIPAEVREKVFLPFWTTKDRGTGLGLPYVRRVAEVAGGRAVVEEVARGACVRLEVPLAIPG